MEDENMKILPEQLYKEMMAGGYECHCDGKTGLYVDPADDQLKDCPECHALVLYMREHKLGAFEHIDTTPTKADEIPF